MFWNIVRRQSYQTTNNVFTDSALWARSVIESQCPSVCGSVLSPCAFFKASHWPSDHMISFQASHWPTQTPTGNKCIGATIRTRQEIQCLPNAGFFILKFYFNQVKRRHHHLFCPWRQIWGKYMAKYSHFLFSITQLNTSTPARRFCQDFHF